jgi:peptidoglycan L-alanyl-D-glutamate endopeptidase CwlK
MNNFKFSQRSENNLKGVHSDLVAIARRALELSPIDFTVTEGLRTLERQEELFKAKKSQTMKSRHLHGFAIDLYPGSWDWPDFYKLEKAMKTAASELGIPLEWGGDWKSFKDGPHFQLPHAHYPDPVS